MSKQIWKCPDGCPYAMSDWQCSDELSNFVHCPTVDRLWKRYGIGKFGEKIHAPKGLSVAEAVSRFYKVGVTQPSGRGKALLSFD